jgi:hypothetical protein
MKKLQLLLTQSYRDYNAFILPVESRLMYFDVLTIWEYEQ